MRDMNNESQDNNWIDSFIEKWIPIHAKDEQFVKEAKVEARKEFKRNVQAEIGRERREAFDRGLRAEQSRHVVQAGKLQQELDEIKNALSVLASLTPQDAGFNQATQQYHSNIRKLFDE